MIKAELHPTPRITWSRPVRKLLPELRRKSRTALAIIAFAVAVTTAVKRKVHDLSVPLTLAKS